VSEYLVRGTGYGVRGVGYEVRSAACGVRGSGKKRFSAYHKPVVVRGTGCGVREIDSYQLEEHIKSIKNFDGKKHHSTSNIF